MTVFVDDIRSFADIEFSNKQAQRFGKQWCHMWADNLDELHQMATDIGLKREWFQWKTSSTPHYDLVPTKRALAIKKGAVVCSVKDRIEQRKQGIFKEQFKLLGRDE